MDAIALVQRFGKPDLFIIMTCNPTWPEIKEHLWTTDETQNRPDLISRVFRAKIEELKTDISKRNIFGKIVVFMYTVEFQKKATATSGVAAAIFPGGRTAHSRFKIPIDIDENFSCNISKQSSTAGLIRDAKLIVWDEVSMAKKRMLDVFDLLLKDLMDTNILFGGKVVVFGGDFRQTLPVVRNGKKEDFISKSLLYSTIWDELEKLQLSENMRAKTDPAFCDYLMRIENGQERVNTNNKLELPDSIIIPFTTEEESLNHLFTLTFSNVHTCSSNPFLQILALF
uniref:ATP-dependent DNA helicase n=1 Tax=Nicotiana tabacum TaxID=4097 RepID=A0A1S3YLU9_TOBAC|nr:PREDICTED: uncharacterized protein LOC107777468 [Nicotiana tabacum]